MINNLAILPEIILLAAVVIFLLFLAIGKQGFSTLPFVWLGFVAQVAAALSTLALRSLGTERISGNYLQHDPGFLYTRAGIFALGAALTILTGYHRQIDDRRKPELCYFLLWVSIFASILVISHHFLVSYLAIFGLSAVNAFLAAAPFRRQGEGKAAMLYWFQSAFAFTLGFGALIVIAAGMNDLSFPAVREFFAHQPIQIALPLFFALALPFWILGGLFPFHHATIVLNHGSLWPIQAAQSLLVQGASVIALFRVAVLVFVVPGAEFSAWILYGFAIIGGLGGIAGGIGALCNQDSKRFVAYLVLLHWSACLVVLGVPSATSVAAAVYQHFSSGIALAILLIVMGGLLESRGSDSLDGLKGVRKRCIFESLLLLGALASLAGIPPFMGFPAAVNMVGALLEQNDPIVLLFYITVVTLQFVVAARLVGIVFFAESNDSDGLFSAMGGLGTRLRVTLFAIFAPLLLAGFFWENVWMELVDRAAKFMVF